MEATYSSWLGRSSSPTPPRDSWRYSVRGEAVKRYWIYRDEIQFKSPLHSSSLRSRTGNGKNLYDRGLYYPLRTTSSIRGPDRLFSLPPKTQLEEALPVQDGDDNESTVVRTLVQGEDNLAEYAAPIGSLWYEFPQRYRLIVTTSLAFVICNMDKVNMSVAIIPMSHQLGWSASIAGLVQSSFFWGYALSQLPGGFLASRFSGKEVLRAGVLLWSVATALVPATSSFLVGLLFCRFLVGLGEGLSPSAATDLIARTMPIHERARAVSFVFGGLNVGSVVGLLLAPAIIKIFSWELVFYLFGIIGIVWCLAFDTASTEGGATETSVMRKQAADPGTRTIEERERALTVSSSTEATKESRKTSPDPHAASFDITDKAIPWRAFFREPAVWAMMYAHFCGNWGHYNLLSWFPTYFSEELNLDLTNAALVSLLPPLGSVLVAGVASSLADYLISKGVDTTFVRKLCQTIAFASPALCMAIAILCPNFPPWVIALVLTVGSSLSTFTLAGLYCTHQDISPKYASILLGITNTVGAFPGIFGVAFTGYVLDQTKSWTLALFAPSMFFYVSGVLIWNVFASSKPKDF